MIYLSLEKIHTKLELDLKKIKLKSIELDKTINSACKIYSEWLFALQ